MITRNFRIWIFIGVGLFCVISAMVSRSTASTPRDEDSARQSVRQLIAEALEGPLSRHLFPNEMTLALTNRPEPLRVNYTIDWEAQSFMERQLKLYKPDYAAFVAIDAESGRILTLVSFSREEKNLGHLALRASFPAASIFKIVTATAALDQRRVTPNTVIGYNGGNHTLYRKNVTQTQMNRWTRYTTLSQAFAKSINSVFAKVGLYSLEPSHLKEYAFRYQFNDQIPSDIAIEPSHFLLEENDTWAIAEAASGFNRVATLSPVHGALMAAAVINDGNLTEPYLVDSLLSTEAELRYQAKSSQIRNVMLPETASWMRALMRETIINGTSRTAFRPLRKHPGLRLIEIGGKTGSIYGGTPKGKYDWFVGYAIGRGHRQAIAALTINEENWRVKSSHLARRYVEHQFGLSP